ncbi:DNA cytosine methyltransferase, partial [Clostridioides difficile]|uniref:DNA cytosine methyltransferase n=1 Tax=Clostridioides difficile TaxID=1496 RepID=UPI0031B63711
STVPPVDLITGGSPCPDLSTAGRRAGMTDGTRSNLWVTMREAIAHVQPTYVVWENVRGSLSAKAASDLEHCPGCMGSPDDRGPVLRALGRVLGDLGDLGFDAEWHGLRASDVGACH